ncbi:MAG: acetyl/propionyl/methylcrotonyl-CoA carboxylase subunit alpha [Rubrivivax sp.]|jgi:3-methylcrotonyl-CoA carboxylase alpha subunit|nr:acetyl/propionyl/methylcrotonyl-CoA carboxylase subunit alpha [Rubrivivax sp.]
MFKKILIANRGEIACRVAATARRLGVRTVAVCSETDRHARHVQACDERVLLGGHSARDSYLRWERIIEAARSTGAQAIHPGYGFLSENADFAQACADAGIVFIGPPASAIRDMGSKAAAKTLMERAGVPLVPGYHGTDNSPDRLASEAERMGYPVLIKASAGGGGRGMRRVDHPADFSEALLSCQREAKASFGDDHVLVERYVTRPRHIEIQVFCDTHGQALYLFERDCSVQRRHQKVLEEAPAPGLSTQRRAEMGAAAVAAARAVGYVGAGTVEFIAEERDDGDLHFYFMEMNTRLQVEHPVTEAITGLDLVEWQFRVASGEALPLTQEQLQIHGHAIEARICAENPEAGFLPATGPLSVMRWPAHVAFQRSHESTRVDTGFAEGDEISPFYDSMIAKVIVWGADRQQALARLDDALRDTHIVGLHTNVAFLRRVVQSRAFATADLDTALIERARAVVFGPSLLGSEWVVAALVAHTLAQEQQCERNDTRHDPFSRRDGWRLSGGSRRRLDLRVEGASCSVVLERQRDGALQMHLETASWPFQCQSRGACQHLVMLGEEQRLLTVYAVGDELTVFGQAGRATVSVVDALAQLSQSPAQDGGLCAPMPGKLVSYLVREGEAVKRGQALAVMEAMKMEHTLHAPRDGVIEQCLYAVADQVPEGAAVIRLSQEAAA